MPEPSATQIRPISFDGGAIESRLDTIGRNVAVAQARATADDAYAPRLGQEPPASSAKYVDPGESADEDEDRVRIDKTFNQRKFKEFVKFWGDMAVKSGAIQPAFFQSYVDIIVKIAPPAVDATVDAYTKAVDQMAFYIKNWYVLAQYGGNLQQLSDAIDASKPKYKAIEGMAPYVAVKRLGESTTFFLIVGFGLSAVCFWKAFQT
jgi:hypothetical protein